MFEKMGDRSHRHPARERPSPADSFSRSQSNEFYYLSGIETPHAYLDPGRPGSSKVTLLLPPRDEALERAEGPDPGRPMMPRRFGRLTGVDQVASARRRWMGTGFASSSGVLEAR